MGPHFGYWFDDARLYLSSISHTYEIGRKHNFQVNVSIDNIGNSSWGVRKLSCYASGSNTGFISPLKYEGRTDSGEPIFSMNKVGGAYPTQTYTNYLKQTYECWQVLLGIRYLFN